MRKTAGAELSEPQNFGALDSFIGFKLRIAQLVVYDDFMRRAPIRRITPGQLAILVLIDCNPGITQQRLSDGIQTEKSTLVVRLHRLADRGLIERVRSKEDRRQNALRLTRRGVSTLKRMVEFVAHHESDITSRLSASERKKLIVMLDKLR